ncbi:MAG TPA: regulatory protein RecX [Gemmatimonadaceae bacterium]|nr:regulatory protein RecX [Gemmatimonadaceae bacterium]
MPFITAVTPSPRREGRFDILVDGKSVGTLSLEAIERLRLHVGTEYSERLAESVAVDGARLRTFDRALDMLAFRGRATRELRNALLRKGEEAGNVDHALERLAEMGLLDDAAYARQYAHAKIVGPGFSRRRLQAELAKRGVARDVADEAIADALAEDDVDSDAILERVAARKLRSLEKEDAPTRRRRLYEFLARRGYDSDDIRRVMDRMLDAD